jgi:glycosyltransferase involved in cell wall biosynthesis
MTPEHNNCRRSPYVSIAIFAWNEERAIAETLQSLLEQSLFQELERLNLQCEIICVANGCTDQTATIADEVLQSLHRNHAHSSAWQGRAVNIPERGKVNAWNQFVHHFSAREARLLFMMDADILIHRRETMWNMLRALEQDAEANISVDVPRKDIGFKERQTLSQRLSMAASRMTLAADGQLCGQLYCIRSFTARKIHLPKELSACEDGLIKLLVCTDFLAHPAWPKRIRVAPDAEHTFEAYTTPVSVLKNQKRQIMGQTMIHVLVDQYLQELPSAERQDLKATLQAKDERDPFWLRSLMQAHLDHTRCCWNLYPGLLKNRFQRLNNLPARQRLKCLPAAIAGSCATLTASFLAHRSLKRGLMDYWPKAQRAGLGPPNSSTRPLGVPDGVGSSGGVT